MFTVLEEEGSSGCGCVEGSMYSIAVRAVGVYTNSRRGCGCKCVLEEGLWVCTVLVKEGGAVAVLAATNTGCVQY